MNPVWVMFRRTLGRLFRSFTAMGAVAVFVSASCAAFFMALGKGGASPVAALWAVAAVPWLQGLVYPLWTILPPLRRRWHPVT